MPRIKVVRFTPDLRASFDSFGCGKVGLMELLKDDSRAVATSNHASISDQPVCVGETNTNACDFINMLVPNKKQSNVKRNMQCATRTSGRFLRRVACKPVVRPLWMPLRRFRPVRLQQPRNPVERQRRIWVGFVLVLLLRHASSPTPSACQSNPIVPVPAFPPLLAAQLYAAAAACRDQPVYKHMCRKINRSIRHSSVPVWVLRYM